MLKCTFFFFFSSSSLFSILLFFHIENWNIHFYRRYKKNVHLSNLFLDFSCCCFFFKILKYMLVKWWVKFHDFFISESVNSFKIIDYITEISQNENKNSYFCLYLTTLVWIKWQILKCLSVKWLFYERKKYNYSYRRLWNIIKRMFLFINIEFSNLKITFFMRLN